MFVVQQMGLPSELLPTPIAFVLEVNKPLLILDSMEQSLNIEHFEIERTLTMIYLILTL